MDEGVSLRDGRAGCRVKQTFKKTPYTRSHQTTDKHVGAFNSRQKTTKRRMHRYARRTKRALAEEEEPTPPELEMRVTTEKKYCVTKQLFKYASKGTSNPYTTKEAAMELAAKCVANRPAGISSVRAQKGYPRGVYDARRGPGYRAQVSPKNTVVTLAAPGGGCIFASAKAAGEAVKNYEKAGSPTKKSDPLYDTLVHHVQRCK